MDNFQIAEKVRKIVDQILEDKDLELVHVEVIGSSNKPTIRILMDKNGGIVHEDCSMVSLQVGDILDENDFISSAYVLEVSSPGIERGLYSLSDFKNFVGELAKVKTKIPIEGQRNFKGRIIGLSKEEIIFDDKTSGTVNFPFSIVKKANLEIDFEEDFTKVRETDK